MADWKKVLAGILKKIVDYKILELESRRRKVSIQDMRSKSRDVESSRPFWGHFNPAEINIIAEIKKASPSAGVIREDFEPTELAHVYEDNGARAISVLTDENFFQGSLRYLVQVKSAVQLPVLRKDFTLSEYDIFEARAHDADAILLIAAILDDFQLRDYNQLAAELGMQALVEVHGVDEYQRCKSLSVDVVGVNNRDLQTFKTNTQTTLDVLELSEGKHRLVSESGLSDPGMLSRLQQRGVYGFLIGEALLRQKNVAAELRRLRGVG